jgi:hypothetical protein
MSYRGVSKRFVVGSCLVVGGVVACGDGIRNPFHDLSTAGAGGSAESGSAGSAAGGRGGAPAGGTGNQGGKGASAGEGTGGSRGGSSGSGGNAGRDGRAGSGGSAEGGDAGEAPGGAAGEDGRECDDGDTRPCYSGPPSTRNVGLCEAGTQTCANDAWGECQAEVTPAADVCNGYDDDCDPTTADGSGDSRVGDACDGPDGDLCSEGTERCENGSFACDDVTDDLPDLCGNGDDDCDPQSADGSEDPGLGVPCDGADTDLCNEGARTCENGALVCSDLTGSTVDLCGNGDEDCDPQSADGSEDPGLGVPCDGADTDLCNEGVRVCSGGALACNDVTGSTVDLCNGLDDDCDAASPDGSGDPLIGSACDGADADACPEGTQTCSGGGFNCSDNTGNSTELCNGVDDDCDGVADEGVVRNDNPQCASDTVFLGSVSGDTGADTLTDTSADEEWIRFTLTENSNLAEYLSATITLEVAPETDFDLYVRCNNCAGNTISSTNPPGMIDTVSVRTNDDAPSDTMDVVVEVRHWMSNVCGAWTLTVTGNTSVATETCN